MNPRALLRIAWWESTRSLGTLDRRTVVLLLIAVLAVGATAPTLVGAGGGTLDNGLYRIAIDDSHPYAPAVANAGTLRTVSDRTEADVVVSQVGIATTDTRRSQAALSALRSAVTDYNRQQLNAESDQAAAFPVLVEIQYTTTDQTVLIPDDPTDTDDQRSGETTVDGDDSDTSTSSSTDETTGSNNTDTSDSDSDSTTDQQTEADSITASDTSTDAPSDTETPSVPEETTGFDILPGDGSQSTSSPPSELSPPFPFGALLLAFLFIVPMNFLIQAYGSTIMGERLNRRGELLLVAPVTRFDIVGGKTLPYLLAVLAITVGIAAAVGGGLLSVMAVVPIALAFLSTTFIAAMFARSYKELTFLTVTISVGLTSYVFVPAIFTDVTPVALISPLTLVVYDLQNEAVSIVEYLFSTGPLYIASGVLYGLGIGVYREEDLFTQRPVHLKALDALAAPTRRLRDVAGLTALFVPFVFISQLLAIAVLFVLPVTVSIPALLVAVAIVEELAKSVHVFAGYAHKRFEQSVQMAVALGLASGGGFFIAEKVTHVTQLVGLDTLELGQAAFMIGEDVAAPVAAVLFFLPLALHTGTAICSAVGARRGTKGYFAGLGVAIALHTLYNAGVIALVG